MIYLKLYEEFKQEEDIIEPELIEQSKDVHQDNRGVYHIENWSIY